MKSVPDAVQSPAVAAGVRVVRSKRTRLKVSRVAPGPRREISLESIRERSVVQSTTAVGRREKKTGKHFVNRFIKYHTRI